jgi:hypothetical protein
VSRAGGRRAPGPREPRRAPPSRRAHPPAGRPRPAPPSAAPPAWPHRIGDQLFKKLRAARLDNGTEAEHRRPAAVSVLIIDDFALTPLDEMATADFCELTVARHRKHATIVTPNRTPDEWVTLMNDPLLAQSAVDRLASTCHELVIEGESYRRRQRPVITPA